MRYDGVGVNETGVVPGSMSPLGTSSSVQGVPGENLTI